MSLYSTTTKVKKVFIWIGAIVGVIILFNVLIGVIKALLPHQQEMPTVSFGKLDQIPFPTNNSQQLTYTLETISGSTPTFPDRETVYKIQPPQPDLVALDNANGIIKKTQDFYGIDPTPITDVLFQWRNPAPPFKTLTYNILTHDFTLTSSYTTYSSVVAAVNLGDQPTAITTAKGYISGINGSFSDIDDSKTTTTLFSINATTGQLQPATSLSSAQIIQVDFFQSDINKMQIYYPNPPHSTMNALVGTGDNGQDVYAAHITHQTVLTNTNATYPIITGDQAWKELQQGKAYIASYGDSPSSNVLIRNISLGYYIGEAPQQYLIPIVIFQGDNGFYAYLNAVSDKWIAK